MLINPLFSTKPLILFFISTCPWFNRIVFPLFQAVCCSEGHCCPHLYKCGLTSSQCYQAADDTSLLEKNSLPRFLSMFKKFPSMSEEESVKSIVCPDKKTRCSDQQTCCLMASGQFGCCPLPNVSNWISYGMSHWPPLLGLYLYGAIPFKSSHCNLFEDRAPVDFIYGCPIFKWVAAETWLHDRVPEKQPHQWLLGGMTHYWKKKKKIPKHRYFISSPLNFHCYSIWEIILRFNDITNTLFWFFPPSELYTDK